MNPSLWGGGGEGGVVEPPPPHIPPGVSDPVFRSLSNQPNERRGKGEQKMPGLNIISKMRCGYGGSWK